MTRTPLALALALMPLGACGADDADAPTTDQPAAAIDAPAAATDTEGPAWTVVLEGPEGAADLPDIEGDELDTSKIGTALQLSGIDPDHELIVRVTVGEELATGEYGPSTFSITWPTLDHTCVGGSENVRVSVEGLEPVRGTFAGQVRCYASSNPTEAFEARMTGTFTDSV